MKGNKKLKVFSGVLAIVLLFTVALSPVTIAASKSDLEKQISALDKKINNSSDKLSALQKDASKQKEYIQALTSEINDLESQITLISEKVNVINSGVLATNKKIAAININIEKKETEIKEVTQKIADKQKEIDKILVLLSQRIRATYMAGSCSELEILLTCDDFSSFLTTSEMLKRVADHDNTIVTSLNKNIKELSDMQNDLEEDKLDLEISKSELDEEKADLVKKLDEQKAEQLIYTNKQKTVTEKYTQANNALSKMNKSASYYNDLIDSYESQSSEIEDQIKQIINNNSGSNSGGNSSGSSSGSDNNTTTPTQSSKGYINPVPYSGAYISSPYGYRIHPIYGTTKFHSGVDISCNGAGGTSGPFTKKIVAAKAGTVTYVGWLGGYGNTVMIDHGGGYVTLYGHNYSLKVSYGQKVAQGQQIAIMGTTGNSTGAHCHFEVRVNGSTVNPANYIKV